MQLVRGSFLYPADHSPPLRQPEQYSRTATTPPNNLGAKLSCFKSTMQYFVLSTHGILALVVFLADFTVAQGANADWPPTANPVKFVGFESEKNIEDLELGLGDILNDNQHMAVEIWTTLQVGNTTLVNIPKGCKVGKNESIELGNVNLTYVYGHGAFTQTYLGMGAPNRYYSLTALSQLVLLPAPERTLKLNVSDMTLWSLMKANYGTALIFDTVTKTLERALRKATNQTDTALDGTLYVRGVGHKRVAKGGLRIELPYLFFSVDNFYNCTRNRPVSLSDANVTLCTRFSPIKVTKFYINAIYASGFFLLITFIILFSFIGYCVWKGELPFYRNYYEKPQNPKLDGSFPSSLSISATFFCASPVDPMKRKTCQLVCYLCMWIFAAIALLALNIGLIVVAAIRFYYSYESYSELKLNFIHSDCVWDQFPIPIDLAISMTVINFLAQLAFTGVAYCLRFPHCYSKKCRYCLRIIVILLLLFLTVFMWLNFVNLVVIASFTLVGLLFFYTDLMLTCLASLLITTHMIFKLGRMNVTISPVIAACKTSLDQAINELQAEAHKKATPSLEAGEKATPALLVPPPAEEWSWQQTSMDGWPADKKICYYFNDPRVRMRALLKLCDNHVPEEDGTVSKGYSPLVEKPYDVEDSKTFERLRNAVMKAFWKHFFKSISKSFLVLFILIILQIILSHYGDLNGGSDFVKYILPSTTLAKYVIDFVKARLQSSNGSNADPVLKAEATRILVDILKYRTSDELEDRSNLRQSSAV